MCSSGNTCQFSVKTFPKLLMIMKCTNTFYPPLLSILRMGSVCVETRCMGVFGAVSRDT